MITSVANSYILVSNVSMSRWSDPETGSYAAATSARQISPMGWKPSFTGITWGLEEASTGLRLGSGSGLGLDLSLRLGQA